MSAPSHPPEPAKPSIDPDHPWIGLEYYTEEMRDYFFGRVAETRELHRRVRANALTVLFGQSGLGKSSLLRAGLFPLVRPEGLVPVEVRLNFRHPTLSLIEQVREALRRALPGHAPDGAATLWEDLHAPVASTGEPGEPRLIPLFVFDQFEELFTLGTDAAPRLGVDEFVVELGAVVQNHAPISLEARLDADPDLVERYDFSRSDYRVLISLREDYLAEFESLKTALPAIMDNRIALKHLSRAGAMEAILGPARIRSETPLLDEATAQAIIDFLTRSETRDPARAARRPRLFADRVEPAFLSLVCSELNGRRSPGGRIDAALLSNSRNEILTGFYNRCLAGQPRAVRVFIEDELVTESGYRESVSEDRASAWLRDRGVAAGALANLVDRRLLRIEDKLDVRRVELTHDILAGVVLASGATRRRRQKIWRRVAVVGGVLLLMLLVLGVVVWDQKRTAEEELQHSMKEQETAKKVARRFATQSSRSDFLLASLYRKDSPHRSMAYLSRALRSDPENHPAETMAWNLAMSIAHAVTEFHHNGAVLSASFSPDGSRVVTASHENSAQVWDAKSGLPLLIPLKHHDHVNSASFSPDGSRIVTASDDNTARVWDAANGLPLTDPLKHDGPVNSADFSPDGSRVVTASDDKTARVWDAANGLPLTDPLKHDGPVKSAGFSPDGSRVVTASDDKTARVWDAVSGQLLTDPLKHDGTVKSAGFSPDGSRVVTASSDKTARVWDAMNGQPLTDPLEHDGYVNWASFSPDGSRVVTASFDETARVWDAASGRPISKPLEHDGPVHLANFSPDGSRVVTASWDGTARVWDATSGRPLTGPLMHDDPVHSASFSPDGSRVVTASFDGTARVWNATGGRPLAVSLKHDGLVKSANFNADGSRVVTASWDNTARVWDTKSGHPLTNPLVHGGLVNSAVFSPDGSRVVTASSDKTARVWDAASGRPLTDPLEHDGPVYSAAFSPDGSRVVTASSDNNARIWDAINGKLLTGPLTHNDQVHSASFSPDGSRVVTASSDKTARVWDAASGQPLTDPLEHDGPVFSAFFSPDGSRVVTASSDNNARVWDATSGKLLTNPLKHDGPVYLASFSPDGSRVVTASWDNTARVWNATNGQPLTDPLKHDGQVFSAVFSADGLCVVTASWDNTARVWDATSGQPLTDPLEHTGPVHSARFNADGSRVVTASSDHTAQVWDIFADNSRAPDWEPAFFDRVSGKHIDDQASYTKSIPGGSLEQFLRVHSVANDRGIRGVFATWLLADRTTRTISPLSTVTVPEYTDRELAEGTRDAVEKAFAANPAHPLAIIARASIEANDQQSAFLRRYAVEHFGKQSATLWERAAGMLQDQNSLDLAMECAERAIQLDSNRASAYWRKADILWQKREWDISFEAADKAIRLDPAQSKWLAERGCRHAMRGSTEKAKSDFKAALQSAPTRKAKERTLLLYGRALVNLDRAGEGIRKLEDAAKLMAEPDKNADLQAGLAIASWLSDDKSESIAAFVRLHKLKPRYGDESYIATLELPEKEITALRQIRSAAFAANPELAKPKPEPEKGNRKPQSKQIEQMPHQRRPVHP